MKKRLEFLKLGAADYNKRMDTDRIAEDFRQAMRRWASGVSVVTARLGERLGGMTVSSFTSVALNPPLVLVALDQASATHALVREAGCYAVTVLGAGQHSLSDHFAHPFTAEDRPFAGIPVFSLRSGAPLLAGGAAWFDCQVVGAHAAGDHTLFVGQVLQLQLGEGQPLVYYDRSYWRLGAKLASR
jgi:flavin reductase (DIM6/NTAB) family NADH-FMN oxidoreductase RutF